MTRHVLASLSGIEACGRRCIASHIPEGQLAIGLRGLALHADTFRDAQKHVLQLRLVHLMANTFACLDPFYTMWAATSVRWGYGAGVMYLLLLQAVGAAHCGECRWSSCLSSA
jgi:hypothetical protein